MKRKPKVPQKARRKPAPGPRPSRPGSRPAPQRPTSARELREDLVLQASLEAYGSIRHEGRLADRALDFTLRRKRNLWSAERRAVAERVYALLRRERTVDYLLAQARPRFQALDISRQDALRLAAARTLMGETPEEVAATCGLPAEDAAAIERLPEAAAALEALPFAERFPIAASLPDSLAQRFLETFGAEAAQAAEAMNERAPLTARANSLRTTREELVARLATEGVEARPTPLSPLGMTLDTRLNAFALPSFRDGFFELQDEGSQLLGVLVDAPPTKVVDACAGAGGKTLQLAAQMKNRGDLYALDVDARRMDELRKRARRAGVHNVRTRVIPPEGPEAEAALQDLKGVADRVLVDAPCSGTGTFRRKPDARYRLEDKDLAMHVSRQKALIARFATMVKPGGRLIYGTCSVLRDENEGVVEDFLLRHPEFTVRPAAEVLGTELGRRVTEGPYLKVLPHRHGTDGFFGAVLVRAR
ncbi:MAG: RsmB/NOP family class I SAM-dependent RNA methyltransferase [Myxococcaceae bacterium]|nr:RsmB/NOP family class I SAM-dependent RNA methyltransferase [Myxococcaceae bacterium]MCI0672957.1 RsmB/NOP family class I SAM-dependent RNA methyltransferase [Myxococcaceae bacterium]